MYESKKESHTFQAEKRGVFEKLVLRRLARKSSRPCFDEPIVPVHRIPGPVSLSQSSFIRSVTIAARTMTLRAAHGRRRRTSGINGSDADSRNAYLCYTYFTLFTMLLTLQLLLPTSPQRSALLDDPALAFPPRILLSTRLIRRLGDPLRHLRVNASRSS